MDPSSLKELVYAFQKSRILLTGFELDIFTQIDESGATSEQLAVKLQVDHHACDRLLNALASLGFLEKHNQRFFNTADSFNLLSRKGSQYQGGLMHSNHLWDSWSQLTTVVESGVPAHSTQINVRGQDWLSAFITAMHDRAIKQAPQQLAHLDLADVKTVLDVGGGSGAYSMELIRKKPEISATVFDLPNVVPITNEFIRKEGFREKIKTYPSPR
ncbi:O-methyltransferase [Mangrovibacterium marinum]|uniref:O-methyltransferase n=1 Tax=Mangrovibacterium marinum TaxID=1639118 RepID=A0A2T5BRV9_9BACT|nr:methyltransferase dimerization domain-containing protein [Mangrovibacterium marinum]PTN02042.1 O-methyltransferase [Mangrovibacterium marinum]